jgi:chromosome partitioning protein
MLADAGRWPAEEPEMRARVLAIANRKGGTGKTTIAVNLAAELGARGYRVLVVDLDPQGHAGLGFDVFSASEADTIHTVFRKSRVNLPASIRTTKEPGVDVIAAARDFDGQIGGGDPRCLAKAFDQIRSDYHVVLLDSPPAAANVMVCALLAAEGVVVPTVLDYLSLDGVQQFMRSYYHVVRKMGATLLGLAIAPMKIDLRTNMQKAVLVRLLSGVGSQQVMRGVYTDVAVAEAFNHRMPLLRHRPQARAVDDFRILADDTERRFNLN